MEIIKLGPCPASAENVYFASNEQAITAAFGFTHAEHTLIILKLYNNWSVQAVNNIS